MRFITTTCEKTVENMANNGYEVYDIMQHSYERYDHAENTMKTDTYNTYYYEYTQELYWLFATRCYTYYSYQNLSDFTIGQIADIMNSYSRPSVPIYIINEDEALNVVDVLEIMNPGNGIAEYLTQNGYAYDLFTQYQSLGSNYRSFVYKINYVNGELDQRSNNLIECIKGYTQTSVNGKISIPKKVNYRIRKLRS